MEIIRDSNKMTCKCGNDTWYLEKRSRNGNWYNVYICRRCKDERLPSVEERKEWNGQP